MHFVMFKILTFYNMLFPTTKIHDLPQNYSLYIFFRIQFADMFSIALTECINRISSSKFHKRQSTIFFCFCTCMWMQFTEMVIKCVLTRCLWLSSRAHSLFKSTYRIFARAFANKRVCYERLRRGRAHM